MIAVGGKDSARPATVAWLALLVAILTLPVPSAHAGADAAAPKPHIEVVNPHYNFGVVFEGTEVKHTFVVRNVGAAKLTIRGVRTSCGCTAAAPAKHQLLPGQQTRVDVAFNTRYHRGNQVHLVTILSDDPSNPSAVMTLQGRVEPQVSATPSEILFGDVRQGSVATRVVVLDDKTHGKDFRVEGISSSETGLKVAHGPRSDGKPGAIIKVRVPRTMPVGPFSDIITVATNRSPVRLVAFGRVTGDLQLNVQQISFGVVHRGQAVTRAAELVNKGKTPVSITGLSSSAKEVKVTSKVISPGKSYKIILHLLSSARSGQIRGKIVIKTNNAREPSLSIPFFGIISRA